MALMLYDYFRNVREILRLIRFNTTLYQAVSNSMFYCGLGNLYLFKVNIVQHYHIQPVLIGGQAEET